MLMAQPVSLDWSWGQAYQTRPFASHSDDMSVATAELPKAPTPAAAGMPVQDLFAHGYTINEFRTAVPSPVTGAEMPSLTLQRANIPRPSIAQFQRIQSSAGRKRSCAEMSSDEDSTSPASISDDLSTSPPKMMRLDGANPNSMDSTGVCAEELAERLRSSSFPDGTARPRAESRKSIKLDAEQAAAAVASAAVEDGAMAVDGQEQAAPLGRARTLSDHDEARVALGVGWSSIPATDVMLAAARGWSRFIETNFSLRNASVVWRNEGMQVILASAVTREFSCHGRELPGTPGYYLFDEELNQGRLVAKSWEKCLDCLRRKPIQFEGNTFARDTAEPAMADAAPVSMTQMHPFLESRPMAMGMSMEID